MVASSFCEERIRLKTGLAVELVRGSVTEVCGCPLISQAEERGAKAFATLHWRRVPAILVLVLARLVVIPPVRSVLCSSSSCAVD